MRRLITAVVPLLLTFAAIGEAAGQTCTAPRAPLRPSESDWVRDHVSCSPYLFGVDGSHWQRVGFNRGSWTGPFAPGAVCDWETPYGRTMLTIEFLAYVQRTWEPRMAQNAAAGLTPRPAGLAAVDAINDLRADCQVKSKATTVNRFLRQCRSRCHQQRSRCPSRLPWMCRPSPRPTPAPVLPSARYRSDGPSLAGPHRVEPNRSHCPEAHDE